jgi:hypothetical protein
MVNSLVPVIFCPVKELQKEEDGAVPPEDYTPFIQAMITYSEIQDQDVYLKKYRGL